MMRSVSKNFGRLIQKSSVLSRVTVAVAVVCVFAAIYAVIKTVLNKMSKSIKLQGDESKISKKFSNSGEHLGKPNMGRSVNDRAEMPERSSNMNKYITVEEEPTMDISLSYDQLDNVSFSGSILDRVYPNRLRKAKQLEKVETAPEEAEEDESSDSDSICSGGSIGTASIVSGLYDGDNTFLAKLYRDFTITSIEGGGGGLKRLLGGEDYCDVDFAKAVYAMTDCENSIKPNFGACNLHPFSIKYSAVLENSFIYNSVEISYASELAGAYVLHNEHKDFISASKYIHENHLSNVKVSKKEMVVGSSGGKQEGKILIIRSPQDMHASHQLNRRDILRNKKQCSKAAKNLIKFSEQFIFTVPDDHDAFDGMTNEIEAMKEEFNKGTARASLSGRIVDKIMGEDSFTFPFSERLADRLLGENAFTFSKTEGKSEVDINIKYATEITESPNPKIKKASHNIALNNYVIAFSIFPYNVDLMLKTMKESGKFTFARKDKAFLTAIAKSARKYIERN